VGFVSLGCAKNLVDSEKMLGQIAEAGCTLTGDPAEADVIVINTCGFLADSRVEALEAIEEMARYKTQGRCSRIVVAGCLVQRDGKKLLAEAAGIDALVGVNNRDDVVRAVLGERSDATRQDSERSGGVDLHLGDYHPHVDIDTSRMRLTPGHYAYLRVSEGCDQKCTFCTIPSIRGPMHSKPPEAILAEARELIADGAVEINLIGQDTTSYGADIGYGPGLAGLLRELNTLSGVGWIRLMYVYPSVFTDEMIEALATCDKVVKYVDIPLQHINDRVLKAMRRRITRAETERLLEKLRTRIEDVTIRTTFIAGFPGETRDEFEELLSFIHGFGFDALGVFPYSLEPDTPAGRMPEQLNDQDKQARADEIMAAQQSIAFARATRYIDRRFKVLVESDDGECIVGRHAGQAPEVDPVTYLDADDLSPGDFVDVRCTGTDEYDLIAEPTSLRLPVVS
jgi:ribosomal protein S12 methylthiotransferase